MINTKLVLMAAMAAIGSTAFGQVVLNDDFTYPDGALIGQGTWAQTGTVVTNPIQVLSGKAVLTGSGQDLYEPFTSVVPHTDGNGITVAFTLNVTSATSGGDYFAHLTDVVGGASNFYGRIYTKTTTGGILLGIASASGGAVYGTTVLSLSTDYQLSLAWTFVAGANNDTFVLSVGGTAYVNTTATAEPTTIAEFNLRQGGSSAPTVTVDNVLVTAVPEPASMAFLGLGAVSLMVLRRRRSLLA